MTGSQGFASDQNQVPGSRQLDVYFLTPFLRLFPAE